MKKKMIVLVILSIFIIIYSNMCIGLIKIDDNIQSKYNLGDMLVVSGHLLPESDVQASFKIKLSCSSEETLLLTKALNLKKQIKYPFNEELFIPFFFEDECILKYEISDQSGTIEEKESEEFSILKNLNTDITLDRKEFQLGENIFLKGKITKLNNGIIDGTATITIKKDEENYLITNTEIKEGIIEEKIGPVLIPDGEYDLVINIRDVYGNEELINNISFKVLTEIKIETQIENYEFLPQDKIKITGKILNLQEISEDFNLRITLGDYYEEKSISYEFKQEFRIPDNVKSDNNELIIEVFDQYGNKGIEKHKIDIIPIIKKIKIQTDKEEYKSSESIIINVTLIDQANNIQNNDVDLTIRKNLFKIYEKTFNTRGVLELGITKELKNGQIKIIVEYEDLKEEIEVIINEIGESKENVVQKGFNYITGDFSLEIKESLKRLRYLIIAIIILIGLILIFSHTTLRREFKHIFKKKYEKAQDEIENKNFLTKKLKKNLDKKHKETHDIKRAAHKYVDRDVLALAVNKKIPKEGLNKNMTALFADIRGYTKFAESAGDKELLKTLKIFFEKVSDSIYRYNGSINQITGDQVFAVFNVIKEDKNHPLNALKAALEIKKNFIKLNKQLAKKNKKTIKIGIGVNTGEALITHLGSDKKVTFTAIGNTINIASRLQTNASSNQILITKNLLDIIKKDIQVVDLGTINLKNVSKPVNVYDVVSLR